MMVSTNEALKATHEKRDIKSQRLIIDAVKDHMIPHVLVKTKEKDIFDSLVSLFHIDNLKIKMIFRNKLRYVWMTKSCY